MKIKLLTLVVIALVSSTAFGQFRTGVQVGAGYSGVSSKSKQNGHLSYSAGVIGEYKLHNGLVFHGELNYVNKGATLDNPEKEQWNGIINRYEFHLHYLELPLSVGYAFDLGNKFTLTPRLGMYAAYGMGGYGLLTSDNLKTNDTPNEIRVNPFKVTQGKMPSQNAQYYFDAFQRPNIGVVMGADLDLSKHMRLSLNSQISTGYPLTYYKTSGNIHFRSIILSVGYLF